MISAGRSNRDMTFETWLPNLLFIVLRKRDLSAINFADSHSFKLSSNRNLFVLSTSWCNCKTPTSCASSTPIVLLLREKTYVIQQAQRVTSSESPISLCHRFQLRYKSGYAFLLIVLVTMKAWYDLFHQGP